MANQKLFKCFSARLANYLSKKGFTVKYIEPNMKCIGRDVWVFDNTPELQQEYSIYCSRSKK